MLCIFEDIAQKDQIYNIIIQYSATKGPAYHSVSNVHETILYKSLVVEKGTTWCTSAGNAPAGAIWGHQVDGILHLVEYYIHTYP